MVCLAAGPVFVDGGGLHAYSSTNGHTSVCACKFRTLGNAREADDGKRGTRVAIMLAWKS